MKYFVTGGTGFIGGRVVRMLREAGHEVVAVVRDPFDKLRTAPSSAGELAELGVRLERGDVTDKESMRRGMQGVDGVFHLAAWYRLGPGSKSPGERINVDGTRNVLELMRELDVPKGVYTSSLAVFSSTRGRLVDESYRHDGPHLSEYDRTKWAAHYQVALPMIQGGLPLVIVQPGLVYGPGDTSLVRELLTQYLRGRLPLVPRGTVLCWGHVEDTARAHLLAMERGKPGESYIVAGPPHSVTEVMSMAERITSIPGPRLHAAPSLLRAAAALAGAVERIVPLPPSYSSEALRSIAGVTYLGSNAKARRELGIQMRPLEEGLRETLEYELSL